MTKQLATLLILMSLSGITHAKNVIGFATIGAVSHQAAIARIGVELVKRGHSFTLLLSREDSLTPARLTHEPFKSVSVLKFSGPAKAGTNDWLRELPREPAGGMSCGDWVKFA